MGITVCDRWRGKDGFLNFFADMGERPDGHTLDRIDGTKNYEPKNCRWATYAQQANNMKSNVWVTIDGEEMTIAQAIKKYKLKGHHSKYYRRIKAGVPPKEAFFE